MVIWDLLSLFITGSIVVFCSLCL